jgi:hypothetical protein
VTRLKKRRPRRIAKSLRTIVAFDEPVVVEGAVGRTDPSEATGVLLDPGGNAAVYSGALRASDPAGNTTEVRLDLTIGDPQDPI